ncbi:MAG: hypothetical protein KJO07_16235 [Deltaproteobacteria bacterium]|nr:hypothetical protein [Deltaproteobacteria bacterium]
MMSSTRHLLAAALACSFAFAAAASAGNKATRSRVVKPRANASKARKTRVQPRRQARGSKLSSKLATRKTSKPGPLSKRQFVRDGIADARALTKSGRLVEAAHVLKGLSAKSKDLTFREKNALAGARAKLRRTALGVAAQGRGELAREGARVNLLLNQPD